MLKQPNNNRHLIQESKFNQRHILDPYRTLGRFISGKISLSQTQPISLAVPTNNSYKVYSDALAIKVVSPPLDDNVDAVLSYNEYSYLRTGDKVIKMKYHHIVSQWSIPRKTIKLKNGEKITSNLMKFQNLIILGEGNTVYAIDQTKKSAYKHQSSETQEYEDQNQFDSFEVKMNFAGMVHPVTYVNKLVLYNQEGLMLVNAISKKILYEYPTLKKYLQQLVQGEQSKKIVTIESSKLVNIVAISLSNGQILIFNLKKDEVVFKLKLKKPAQCIAFCDEHALMSTSDAQGNVVLWDLENKKILYKFQQFISGCIDSMIFIPGQQILTCGSSQINCIKQLRINLQDNRILTLFRERVGITEPIQKIKLLNNTEIMLTSKSESMFTSLYNHSNNYKLDQKVLDSSAINQLATTKHIISRHFNVQLFKNQTMEKSYNIHESAYCGCISLSQKYFIVGTRTRLLKLSGQGTNTNINSASSKSSGTINNEIKITGIQSIILFQQHYILVFTERDLIVLDFATFTLVKECNFGKCSKPVVNQFGNLVAFYQQNDRKIVVYDMQNLQIARQYPYENLSENEIPNCMCFTSDNRYLLSSWGSDSNPTLSIWSIVHNNLFKEFKLSAPIVFMSFTEDNQFFLSVFKQSRQINIWNNYIGKISSNRDTTELLKFKVKINYDVSDFREVISQYFNKKINRQSNKVCLEDTQQQEPKDDDILDKIQDSQDASIPNYKFDVSQQKWLPLIYYDQIKQRNTLEGAKQISMPFFLDFSNIDEQKKKIQQEAKQDLLNRKKQKQDKIDKHLKNEDHSINLSSSSTPEQFYKCIKMLESLTLAEIDYQLRNFLLNPVNKKFLLQMFIIILDQNNEQYFQVSDEFKNIIFYRTLDLIGTDIFDQQSKQIVRNLVDSYNPKLKIQKGKVDKCISIIEKMM